MDHSRLASSNHRLLGGRLAIDFANTAVPAKDLSWEELVEFLEAGRIVSSERRAHLHPLSQTEPQVVDGVLLKALRLREALRAIFGAMIRKERFPREWAEPINDVLRITEGHDELVQEHGAWRIEFVAREGGLDWLLAAIAHSAAEIIGEGVSARMRLCANPDCGLFFYDTSRTRRRRWCSMALCGNRHKVAAFARRQASRRREA
jgi:predicted RNA-binding Zn ribbon-like protein